MAGRGPAPKPKEQRRNRSAPQRGEWVDLEPLGKPVLAAADAEWPPHVRALWVAWRDDPVTGQYSSADLAAIYLLASQFDDLKPNEQRLRMDGLGLTPKGKRDLRFRLVDHQPQAARPKLAEVRRLRAVESKPAA